MNQPRLATKDDMPRVLELIKELAIFEKEPEAVKVTLNDLQTDGFCVYPKFTCFVIEVDDKVEGMALVYPRYSTWKGFVLHLEDLIVSEKCRGKGLGTLLLNRVVGYGKSIGAKRISWVVLDWNESAIEFYKKKGATILKNWNVVQLNENEMDNYLNQI